MKCVITGANGFLGQSLIKRLIEREHHCLGLVRRKESMPIVEKLGANAEQVDLFDHARLTEILKKYQPDAMFHLAAEIATQRNKDLIYRVNVEGTRLLAEVCRQLNLKAFVYASTVERYGTKSNFCPYWFLKLRRIFFRSRFRPIE